MDFAFAMLIIFGGIPLLWMIGSGIETYLNNKGKQKDK